MPLEPILELRKAAVIHAAAVHLRVDGSAHASRAEDGPRRPTELREEIRPLDPFKDHALAAVDADSLARPRHRQAISVGQLQCPYLGIEGRGVEAGAEEAQDLAVLPGEHLSFAALGDFLEPAFDCHRGGRYYKPCPESRSVTEVTSATMGAIDYDAWAQTYDDTRGASPSVLRPMLTALGPAASRSLLDIGGGTGNFAKALADEGFHVRLCDYSPEMARRAVVKLSGAPVFVADAAHLPFAEGSFDSAISVNVLGHVEAVDAFGSAAGHSRRSVCHEGVDARDTGGELGRRVPARHPRPRSSAPLPAGKRDHRRAAGSGLLACRVESRALYGDGGRLHPGAQALPRGLPR